MDPDCTVDESFAHSWTSKAGVEHVFYGVSGNESCSCESGAQWHAWQAPGEGWTSERTPYVGRLMAVAGAKGKKAVWLMYADGAGVHLAKREGNGNYRDVELLSELGLGTHIIPAGDLAVKKGEWWAVWTENRNPTGFGTTDLWQAKTMGTPLERTGITDTPAEHDDQPSLAVRSDRSAVLLWTRMPDDPDLLSMARYGESANGTWSNQEWDSGYVGAVGDVDVSGGDRVSVVWARGGTMQYATTAPARSSRSRSRPGPACRRSPSPAGGCTSPRRCRASAGTC